MSHSYIIEIPQNQYSIIKQIGSGTFSDIFSATHIKTNTIVALKVSLKTHTEEYDKMLDHEVEINKTLHHPFICKFFTEFETEHLNVIVMELVDGITSLDYVNQTHGLPVSEVRNLFTQLLIVIEYLHNEVCITHRDLKLENIMIDNCGHIRLIDFGFSTKKSMMSTLCGSIPYCAPEVLLGQLYTKESDIWSMGVILYALYNGSLPFYHSNTNTLANIICNNEVKYKSDFDESLKDLLNKILVKDPEQRIKIDDIKQHPFISQERILQIDYKQLFSPSNHINSSQTSQSIKSESIKLTKPSSKLGSPPNNSSQIRKSGFFRIPGSSINFPQQMHDILHEKITQKTNDVDLSIENRKDFAHNLTKLIEYELLQNLPHSNSSFASYDNIPLSENQFLSSTSHHLSAPNNPLITLTANQPGTSDHINGVTGHSHHYVLTNRFSAMMKTHDNLSVHHQSDCKHSETGKNTNETAPISEKKNQINKIVEPNVQEQQQSSDYQQNQEPQLQLQHSARINATYTASRPHILSSLGLQQHHLMKVSHKRRSSNIRNMSNPYHFVSPFVTHSKSNFSEE